MTVKQTLNTLGWATLILMVVAILAGCTSEDALRKYVAAENGVRGSYTSAIVIVYPATSEVEINIDYVDLSGITTMRSRSVWFHTETGYRGAPVFTASIGGTSTTVKSGLVQLTEAGDEATLMGLMEGETYTSKLRRVE